MKKNQEYSPTIRTSKVGSHIPSTIQNFRIRRLALIECFQLMDFKDNFKWDVSDTQAYKQAGNLVVKACYISIIKKLFKSNLINI